MTQIIIDPKVSHAIEREYLGNLRFGFLLGARRHSVVEVVDYAMMHYGPSLLSKADMNWWRNSDLMQRGIPETHALLQRRLQERHGELAVVGAILQVESEIPRQFLGELCEHLRFISEPAILLTVEDRKQFTGQVQRTVLALEMFTLAGCPLRPPQPVRQALARAIEDGVDAFWRDLKAKDTKRPRRTLRCVLDPAFERQLLGFVEAHTHGEVGGVLLGTRADGTTRIRCAVFGPQRLSAAMVCEFDTGTMQRICDILESLDSDDQVQPVGWVHTHPGLGVFFSETDVHTFSRWAKLDPAALALVVDPKASINKRYLLNGEMREIAVEDRALPRWRHAAELALHLSNPPQQGSGVWSVIDAGEVNRFESAPMMPGTPEYRRPADDYEYAPISLGPRHAGMHTAHADSSSGAAGLRHSQPREILIPRPIVERMRDVGPESSDLWLAVGDDDGAQQMILALIGLPAIEREAGRFLNDLVIWLIDHSYLPLAIVVHQKFAGLTQSRQAGRRLAEKAGLDPRPDALHCIDDPYLWSTSVVHEAVGCLHGQRRPLLRERLREFARSRHDADRPIHVCDEDGIAKIAAR